jgi:CRISPR-associated endonuclease/helicase Cas3
MMNSSVILAHIDPVTRREQTLAEHSEKTARLCEKYCEKIGMAKLGRLVGLLHDSGKATNAFQQYLETSNESLRGKIPHSFCGARYSLQMGESNSAIEKLTAEFLATAICAHHSGLPDVTGVDASDNLHRRAWPEKEVHYEEALEGFFRDIPRESLTLLFQEAQKETANFCTKIRNICGEIPPATRNQTFYFMLGLLQRYLFSCLIDADRYDTFLFEAQQKAEPEPNLPELWSRLAANLEEHLKNFPLDTPINRKRREISDQCYAFSRHATGIFRLSVPTGSGKTMASLRYALNCAKQNGKERIFYIAPYKSILDQNAEEIRKALKIHNDTILLEHHSDVVVDTDDAKVAARYRLLTERWNTPMILTTAVQFLNTLFDGRSACARRMHSLANSVIILDEFQAFPVKCTNMLNAALNFLAYACNCSVVLCTATQPESEEIPVPLLFGEPSQMTSRLEETFAAFRRTRTVDKTSDGPLSAEQLADFALERLALCDNLLMVFNTKAAAKAVYRSLTERMNQQPPEERIPIFCLTTSQCAQHRMDLIREIQSRLADGRPRANRMICVSTQLIEAGVDLSFQCVVRSFAGLDSAAQAAGRCNRHGESTCRDVFLVRCAEENLSRLQDIQRAQEAADQVLQDFSGNSAQFHEELLSPEAVRRYYHYYFDLQRAQLNYPVTEKDDPALFAPTSLFDLLSVNSLAKKFTREHRVSLPAHPIHQAYATAGRIFQAIDNSGTDVIVPYGAGEDLIQQLYAKPDLSVLPKLLRQAQRYSVNLFPYERSQLEEFRAIDIIEDVGVMVLRKEFYSMDLGVQMQREEMDSLIV